MTQTDLKPLSGESVLVPIDMRQTGASEKALATAVALAGQTGAQLHIMTVARPLGAGMTELPESEAEPAFKAHVETLSRAHGRPMTAQFRSHESPDVAILNTIGDLDIGLVVMNSHDPRWTDHIFGSHASRIVRDAPCSVLVVR